MRRLTESGATTHCIFVSNVHHNSQVGSHTVPLLSLSSAASKGSIREEPTVTEEPAMTWLGVPEVAIPRGFSLRAVLPYWILSSNF